MATMAEMPAPAVAGRGNLPGAAAGGSSDTDTSSRIHHTQHKAHHSSHNSDDTEIPSSSQAPPQSVAAASSSSSYAFITHSQEGLRENRPPMIDNAGLARRRRRRTSQHDQAILEEEYRKCDRPDKAKRREIAAMVEMGDKEVQIWFQNKRQSARRKLKPLLPHEIIPNAMKSSSSPAPSYQHHHHYHHHRTGYTGLWSKEESRVEEELERQGRNEEKMRDMKKFRDRHLDFGPVEEPLSRADREGNAVGGRARNSSSQECSMRESHREQEQEVECLDQGSSQDQEFSSSQSSSQNHGYYSQQETPARGGQDDGDKVDDEQKLPPAAVRRMSMSHMRLQEALSSPLRPPPPPPPARAASLLPTPQSTQQQRRYSFAREPPSELSEYIHSDFPQQQTPIKPPPVPPLALPTPQATNPRRTNPQGAYQPPSLQKRSSSFLRLSTSIDGHAEVVIDTEPTLPPPLPHSRSDQMTPRRGVPVPSTSSVLRDIDNMRSSRLWEFCCDKQKQPYLSSEGGLAGIPHHHHHHSALEPDEAGMALSIARSRRRVGALKEARRKLVFDDVELMRDDSGLGALIDDPEVQRRGSFYEDDGPFGGGKIHSVEKAVKKSSNSSIEKKRVSLGDLGSAIRTPARSGTVKSSTYMTNSTSRKRAYHEIEIYEQPSSSQTTDPLPSTKRRASGALPMQLSDVKKKQQFSSPRGRAGGEDYYIFGHESDKENYGEGQVEDSHDGGKAVFGEIINNGKQQRPMKATKKPLEKDREKWRSGEKVLPPPLSSMDVAKKQKVKVIHRDNAVGRREEKRLKKKRKVLGEVAGGPQSQVQSSAQTQPVDLKRKERPQSQRQGEGQGRTDSDVDLGGAELLLSLSAGRWGC